MQPLPHLPDWPARRLVTEAVIAYGLRHQQEEYIDEQCAPWPLVRGAVLAFLRHQLTDYDNQLLARCGHDPAYRDELARTVQEAAYRKYPWLRDDPRPFSSAESQKGELFFDALAKQLADLHSLRAHLASAATDLRRKGDAPKEHLSVLQDETTRVARQIEELYKFLTKPKTGRDADGDYSRSLTLSRKGKEQEYYFYHARPLPAYRLDYIGVKCPRCDASVARAKELLNLGQGYNRVVVWSCHCVTYLAYQAPRMRLAPVTLVHWARLIQKTETKQFTTKNHTYE
jgi:hypothetical protein